MGLTVFFWRAILLPWRKRVASQSPAGDGARLPELGIVMGWSEIAAVTAVALSLLSVTWHVVVYLRGKLPALDMEVRVLVDAEEQEDTENGRPVLIRCELGNTGRHKLFVKEAKLIVDEGRLEESQNEVCFPSIWQWRKRCPDCELSRWFQSNRGNEYPGYVDEAEIEDKYTACKDMSYFVKALEYVLPGERFADTKIMYLDEDKFYRVTFVVIPEPLPFLLFFTRRVDCLCVTTQLAPRPFVEIGQPSWRG